jgi:hypothetical protein
VEAEKAPEVTVPSAPAVEVAPAAAPVELAPEVVPPEPSLELTPAPVAVAEKAPEAVPPSALAEVAPVAAVVAEKEPETLALPAPTEELALDVTPPAEEEPEKLAAAAPVAEPSSQPSESEENVQAAAPVAEKVVGFPELEDEPEAAPTVEPREQAAPLEVVAKPAAPEVVRKSLEEDFLEEPSAPEVSPLSQAAAEATQREVEVPAEKQELAAQAPALVAAVPSRRPPSFIELPSEEPAEKMELAEPWEFSGGWQQDGKLDTETGHAARPPDEGRGIELDTSEAGASNSPQDEVMLASAFDFMPKWQRLEEQQHAEESPAETVVPQASAVAEQGSGAASSDAPTVPLEEALAAIRGATTKGALGKALLSYCQGRYARAFLLGETFGFARVGLAYGPGSDRADVSTLQVDLEAPSLLLAAATGGKPVVSSIPESPEDEALFLALGEQFSHLMAAPIRLHERTVAYVVIDGGPGTFDPAEVEELEQVVAVASSEYSRLHGSAS